MHYSQSQLRVQYAIAANNGLKVTLDHLFSGSTQFPIIEAPGEDWELGTTKLVTALIALDQWERTPDQPDLLGILTTGHLWQVARLKRATQQIELDVKRDRIPKDLAPLIRRMVYILRPRSH